MSEVLEEVVKTVDGDESAETVKEEIKEGSTELVEKTTKEILEETGNIKPTKETPEEIVEQIFSKISEEGFRNSLERMGKLENEMREKIEKMQLTFTKFYDSMQADIDKFKAIEQSDEKEGSTQDTLNITTEQADVKENVETIDNINTSTTEQVEANVNVISDGTQNIEPTENNTTNQVVANGNVTNNTDTENINNAQVNENGDGIVGIKDTDKNIITGNSEGNVDNKHIPSEKIMANNVKSNEKSQDATSKNIEVDKGKGKKKKVKGGKKLFF